MSDVNLNYEAGRIISSHLADLYSPVLVQTAILILTTLLTFILTTLTNTAGLVSFSVAFGGLAGAYMGLLPAGVIYISKEQSSKMIGTRLGMSLAFVGCGVLVGGPIAGAIDGRGS